jgi:predicted Rossmann fold flavoprotein
MKRAKIAIIGGGAAGLMAAASLIEEVTETDIHLFEKNPSLGAKVIISGGGRCNVTTGITDKKELFSKYTRGANFLKTAIGKLPPEKVYEWFENHGVPLKCEADQRVFPVSNKGKDVVGVFEKLFKENKVQVHFKENVSEITPQKDGCLLKSNQREELFDYVILTTGGNAYQHTGSTGDGYSFAKAFGHSMTKLGPSLNSFLCHENWPKTISGISLEEATLSAKTDDGEKVSATGPMLFTHFGISGPAVFALSSHLAFSEVSPENPIQVSIRVKAEINAAQWDKLLMDTFNEQGNKQILNTLKEHLPTRLCKSILDKADISVEKKNSELSKKARIRLSEFLGGQLKVSLAKRRAGDEFVTAGGVSRDEISSKKMQSKLDPRLFFGGEIMDVDGVTGGFNLQASWATGRLAAKSLAGIIEEGGA